MTEHQSYNTLILYIIICYQYLIHCDAPIMHLLHGISYISLYDYLTLILTLRIG